MINSRTTRGSKYKSAIFAGRYARHSLLSDDVTVVVVVAIVFTIVISFVFYCAT